MRKIGAIVNVDEKGRMVIPKGIQEKIGVTQGGHIRITADEDKAVIEPLRSIANTHYGAYNITRWPEDLDQYSSDALKRGWKNEPT